MKKIKLFLAAALGLLAVGCYNDFDTPAPAKVWTDEEVEALGLTQISIKELKDRFIKAFGSLENTGNNGSWADTKTLKCGPAANDIEALFENDPENLVGNPQNMKFWDEAENYYIKGKVISSDAQGNVYKSLYIDDGTGAIELKLCGTLYTIYKLDLTRMDTQWVYVKLNGLYLGNYRMMLSLGDAPSNALNTGGANKFYANSNFETPLLWRNTSIAEYNRVLPGEPCQLVEASIDDNNPEANIIAVNSSNYDKLGEDYYSRLIRFKDVTIRYAGVTYQNPVAYDEEGNVTEWSENIEAPAIGDDYFPNYIVTDTGVPEWYQWYRWAYSNVDQGVSLYGSVLMLLNDSATDTNQAGVYSIRTSGYSRFAMKPIPADGTVGTVLGIYSIYSKTLRYAQYQITVNRIEDLNFPEESLLSEAWIAHNTPPESYTPNVKNGAGEYDDD